MRQGSKNAAGSLPDEHRAISSGLVRARAEGRALPGPPSGLPDTLEAAYRLQDRSIAEWPDTVAGWKVGGVPAAYRERFDERFLAGPIFASSVRHARPGEPTQMPVFADGFAAIEPEFVISLGASAATDRMFIGAEIASSPIPDINDYGPVAVISDFGNNNGLLLGSEIPEWRDRNEPFSVTCTIDGETVGTRVVDDFPAAALESLAFLRRLAERRGYDLPEGTYVSTGAITGVHEALPGARGRCDFGTLGGFDLLLTPVPTT
ncbi:2-keto-4-pentenoate hydratase [Aurantiacibacter spongiae]|uniref:2-keto-4-pentenoate hydratase n=1 Tax=Aurantiacibacter spongiae TaxID=2488860 RepID=A0A3N5D8L1_9SPHN|nr:2-keto-4-pentenoate hydratase [Aurantiacibacter spongiae]RPF70958.1 2-keto-4-pentenoate hydratase [Aurantiacibacter spongiae]